MAAQSSSEKFSNRAITPERDARPFAIGVSVSTISHRETYMWTKALGVFAIILFGI